MLILEVIRIGNLFGLPDTIKVGISNYWGWPLALVVWIKLLGLLPRSAAWSGFAIRIFNHRSLPFTVSFSVPICRLFGFGIGNELGSVRKPTLGHGGFLIYNKLGSRFIPIIRFLSVRIRNFLAFIPGIWFFIIWIINFSRWINSRSAIEKKP